MSQADPKHQNHWQLILLLLAAFGVPVAAATTQFERITTTPWLALALLVVWELIVLVLGFITDVWGRLREIWGERTAKWIDRRVIALLSRYRKKYEEHLIYRHRDFDVKGLSTQGPYTLELEKVFVELRLQPQAPHMASGDPVRKPPKELQEGRHTIWDFLTSPHLHYLVIIGPPGSGKTTLLKHIAIFLAGGRKRRKQVGLRDTLPILLFLRDHAKAIQKDPNIDLVHLLQATLKKWNVEAPEGWFERRLEKGECLVMLDGLDEVPEAARKVVATWLETQMKKYASSRFLITSRPHGYRSTPLSGVNVIEILPFDQKQVRRFVENWYLANEIMSAQKDDPGVRMKAKEGAEDLLRRLGSTPALSDLAVNPLLLTMIATVHRYKSSLPGRRVELYKEICEVFLGKWQQKKGIEPDLTPPQRQRVLQPLAWHLMETERRELPVEEAVHVIADTLARVAPTKDGVTFLQELEADTGLILEREQGVYGFAHLTFQEYLASVHAIEHRLSDALIAHIENPWWHETIRLYAAQADATPVLAACLKDEPPTVTALALALEVEAEALEAAPHVRRRLRTLLEEGAESEDPERRRVVAEALLSRRLQHLVRLDEDRYVDPELITHIEYQLFLDEKRAQGEYRQPDHWQSYHFPPGEGLKPVLGVRPSDAEAFCQWLTERSGGLWRYRLPKPEETPWPGKWGTGVTWWIQEGGGQAPAGNHVQAVNFDVKFVYGLDFARDRALDLALDIILTLALTRDLDRTKTAIRALVKDLARIEVIVRNFLNDLNRASVHHLVDRISRILDLERTRLFSDFELALNVAYDLGGALAHATSYDEGLEHARKLAREIALARNLDFTFDYDSNILLTRDLGYSLRYADDLAHDLVYSRTLEQSQDIARDLARTVAYAHDLACELDRDSQRMRAELRTVARLMLLYVVELSLAEIRHLRSGSGLFEFISRLFNFISKRHSPSWEQLRDECLNLYLDLLILEERIEGRMPAVEGIRIVRERIGE